ncbi:MAG TPA: DUF1330 domain-containing protein [Noviherbaspirillum sp.]
MRSINPTPASVKQLVANVPPGIPVVMLNLLRFRDRADYPPEMELPSCSGRDAYAEYSRLVGPLLARVGGKVIWQGEARHAFIAPEGEEWDEVLLVAYPSRDAFLGMLKSPDYQAITVHRTSALEDARLIATV